MFSRALLLLATTTALLALAGAPASAATHPWIVVVRDSAGDPGAIATRDGIHPDHVYTSALRGFSGRVSDAALTVLRADPDVSSLEPDRSFVGRPEPAVAAPPQPVQVPSVAIRRIGADVSSTRSGDGRGAVPVNVAVIDTGVDPAHPDLTVAGGHNCADGTGFNDTIGHGTMVAGLIGARDNAIGRVGVVPGARIWGVRIFDRDGSDNTVAESICGVDWVASTRRDRDPGNDISVANLSIGDVGSDDNRCGSSATEGELGAFHQAICGLLAAGVIPVASAGNDGSDLAGQAPATYGEVLTVTAMDDVDGRPGGLAGPDDCEPGTTDDAAAFFSNFATTVLDRLHTLAAPGVCVGTLFPGGLYTGATGTSFSAPLVAGTVALCLANGACRGLPPRLVMAKIMADARLYNVTHPAYGYQGDPRRPIGGRGYGDLVYAGLY